MNQFSMSEQEINTMLQKTRIVADMYERKGKHELGLQVLRTGSTLAQLRLKIIGVVYHPFRCAEMGHVLKDRVSQRFYIETGVCLFCDHLRSDEMDDRAEMEGGNHE